MMQSIISIVTIVIAIIVAALAIALPPTSLHFIVTVSRFIEIMIPFLAAGALIKYLCSSLTDKNG